MTRGFLLPCALILDTCALSPGPNALAHLGVKYATGTIISSMLMPPCWKVLR